MTETATVNNQRRIGIGGGHKTKRADSGRGGRQGDSWDDSIRHPYSLPAREHLPSFSWIERPWLGGALNQRE
jgi:hypothetical protein